MMKKENGLGAAGRTAGREALRPGAAGSAEKGDGWMEKKSYCIQIDGTRNHTRQGILHTAQGQIPFRSELELILAVQRDLCGENETEKKERGTQSC